MYCWTKNYLHPTTPTPFFYWKLGFWLRVSFLCEGQYFLQKYWFFTWKLFIEIQNSDSWCSGNPCTSFFFLVYSVPCRASPMMHCHQGGKIQHSIMELISCERPWNSNRVLNLRYLWFLLKQSEFYFSPEAPKYRRKMPSWKGCNQWPR